MAKDPKVNPYDKYDIVRREACMLAGALKLALYTVAMPGQSHDDAVRQVHFTYENTVEAAMPFTSAIRFAGFIKRIQQGEIGLPDLATGYYEHVGQMTMCAWIPEAAMPLNVFFAAKQGDHVLALLRGPQTAKLFSDMVERWV